MEVTTSNHLRQQWMSTENKSNTSSLECRVSEVSAVSCCWPGMKCDFHIMNVAVKGASSGWTCSRTIVSLKLQAQVIQRTMNCVKRKLKEVVMCS